MQFEDIDRAEQLDHVWFDEVFWEDSRLFFVALVENLKEGTNVLNI